MILRRQLPEAAQTYSAAMPRTAPSKNLFDLPQWFHPATSAITMCNGGAGSEDMWLHWRIASNAALACLVLHHLGCRQKHAETLLRWERAAAHKQAQLCCNVLDVLHAAASWAAEGRQHRAWPAMATCGAACIPIWQQRHLPDQVCKLAHKAQCREQEGELFQKVRPGQWHPCSMVSAHKIRLHSTAQRPLGRIIQGVWIIL